MKILYDNIMKKNRMRMKKRGLLLFLLSMLLLVTGCGVRIHPTLGLSLIHI